MGVSLWFYQETADGQMKRLPYAQFQRFYDGKTGILDRRGDALQTAQIAIEVQGRRVARVLQVNWPRYATTSDGYIDDVHKQESMYLAMRMVSGFMDTDNLVSLDPHLARQEMQRSRQWSPSELQVQQVALALNSAAIHPPVVAVARGKLMPL